MMKVKMKVKMKEEEGEGRKVVGGKAHLPGTTQEIFRGENGDSILNWPGGFTDDSRQLLLLCFGLQNRVHPPFCLMKEGRKEAK